MDDILLEILDSLAVNFEKSRRGHYKRVTIEMPKDHEVTHGGLYKLYMNKVSDFNFLRRIKYIENPKITTNDKVVWKGENGIQEQIEWVIRKEVEDFRKTFVDRQRGKLSPVIKGRKVIHHTSTLSGHLTDHTNILLEDNSSFTLQTNVIWEYSNRGRVKWILPTKFLDVVTSKGKKHKTLSHARMKSEF